MVFYPPHLKNGSAWAGLRVGLLGGSFNPPHKGHLHASLIAMNTMVLDAIWWLVTPQNPLKTESDLSFSERYDACTALVNNPRIIISDIENELGTNLTWQTIRGINAHFPRTEFVWITGMDNALGMHTWNNWTDILDNVATAHVARPPAWSLIENCPLKMIKTQQHRYLEKAQKVPLLPRHTYWLMQKKMVGISSSEIRNNVLKTAG